MVHIMNTLGKTVWVFSASGKGKPICVIAFAQGPGCMWWVMQKEGDVHCVPQSDLMLRQNNLNHPSCTERQIEANAMN